MSLNPPRKITRTEHVQRFFIDNKDVVLVVTSILLGFVLGKL